MSQTGNLQAKISIVLSLVIIKCSGWEKYFVITEATMLCKSSDRYREDVLIGTQIRSVSKVLKYKTTLSSMTSKYNLQEIVVFWSCPPPQVQVGNILHFVQSENSICYCQPHKICQRTRISCNQHPFSNFFSVATVVDAKASWYFTQAYYDERKNVRFGSRFAGGIP